MRSRLFLLLIALSALCSLGASCSGAQGENHSNSTQQGGEDEQERPPQVERLEQVNTDELTPSERRVWVDLINDLLSPCGDPISVGRCVAEHRRCGRCVPAGRYLARLVAEGYERTEIESHYNLRYGRGEEHELELEGAPTRGAPMAAVTIVEFSDFECPHCGRAHPILQQVLSEFEGRVKLVFKHYPLASHPHAMPAARAAIAAGNQGKFWEMHDLLFEHQRNLEDEDLTHYAEQLELDLERFRADMAASETQSRIDADRAEGRRLDVEGTPSFFINGRRFDESPSSLPFYIREELDQ